MNDSPIKISPIKNSLDNRYSNSNKLEVVDIDSKSLAKIWEIYERLRNESIGSDNAKDNNSEFSKSSPNNNLKSFYALEKKLSLISIIKIRVANIIDLDYFSISLYPSLQELYLDSIPPSTISDLFQFRDQLKVLEFVNSGITDIYSALAKDVEFDKLKHFKPLVILNETRTVPSNTIQWKSLHTLTLSNCGINKLDQAMHLFPSITELDLSKNDIVHVIHLQDCYCLSVLNLSHNRIRVLSNLGHSLGKVTKLNLCNNEIESLDGISFIYSLERLDVSFNYINDFSEIQYLSKLPCLEIIVLEGNPIADHINYRLLVFKEFLNDGSILSSNRQLPAIDGLSMNKKEKKALRGIMFRAPQNVQRESTKKKDDFFQSEQQSSGYSPLLHYRLTTVSNAVGTGNQHTPTSLEEAFNRTFSGDVGRAKARYNFEARSDKSPLSTPSRSSQSTPRSSPNNASYFLDNNMLSPDYPSVFPALDEIGPLGNKILSKKNPETLPRKMSESEILVGFKSQIKYENTSKTNSLTTSNLMNEDGIEVNVTDIIGRCNATLRNRKRRIALIMDTEMVTEIVDLNYVKQICKEKHLLDKEVKRKILLLELEEKEKREKEKEKEKEKFLITSKLNAKSIITSTSTTSSLNSNPVTTPIVNSSISNSNDKYNDEKLNLVDIIDNNNNNNNNNKSNLAIELNKNNETKKSEINKYDTTASSLLSELQRGNKNLIETNNDDSTVNRPLFPNEVIISMDEFLAPLENRITKESSNLITEEEIINNIINNSNNEINDRKINNNRSNSIDSDSSNDNNDFNSFSEFNKGNVEQKKNIKPVVIAPKAVHVNLNDSLLTSEFDKISISNLIKDKQLKHDLLVDTIETRERVSSSEETTRWPSLSNKYTSEKQVYIGNVEYLQLSILDNLELYCREQIFALNRPSGDSPYIQIDQNNNNETWEVEFIAPPLLTERFACVYCENVIELSPSNQVVVNKSNPSSPNPSNITEETMVPETKALIILTDCNLYVVKYDSINPNATFENAPIPTLIHSYHLYTLNICTIFFGFQRCVLGFCEPKSQSKYSNSNSPVKFQSSNPTTPVRSFSPTQDQPPSHLLMILTRDKSHTYPIITRIPQLANSARCHEDRSLGNVKIENKDSQLLDTIMLTTQPLEVDPDVVYYQMLFQVWRKRPDYIQARTIIFTPSLLLLCSEDLTQENVVLSVIDTCNIKSLLKVQIEENPLYITFILKGSKMFSPSRKWRLKGISRQSITKLYEECNRLIAQMF